VPDRKEIIAGFASAVIIFLILFASGLYLIGDPILRQTLRFSLIASDIAVFYPLPVDGDHAFDAAERGLFSLLDPFSFRIDHEDYQYLREESSGEYGGIGITVVVRDTCLMVMSVREGGPADRGGIRTGDCIVVVNDVTIPAEDPGSATDLIRGPSGTDVSLTLYRSTIDDTLTMTLTRTNIKLEHMPYYGLTASSCGYIRLADFEAGAAEELREAVRDLENRTPRGYIIDLKGNPGGYLNEAIDAADIFLDEGTMIVGTDGRSRWENRRYLAANQSMTEKPIIVLADRGTASAAEIFTGALDAADRCVVIGDTTFGKGLVQSLYSLPNRDAIRLTVSRYYFADGRYLNPPDSELSFSGLAPDIVYDPPGEIALEESVLSGFLIYDFIESEWDLLSSYPATYNYPDTVITLFENFVASRGISYESWLTEILSLTVSDQYLSDASDTIVNHLRGMLEKSRRLDREVFRRHASLLKYHIRRLTVEKKEGRAASYREVIVPGRADILLAESILTEPDRYQAYIKRLADNE